MTEGRRYHIGVVGTGFIARGAMMALQHFPQLTISCVLTRRMKETVEVPALKNVVTNNPEELVKKCDLVVECSGDAIHGTEVIYPVLKAGIPVVTMDSELQLVSGTGLAKIGTIVEAEGDQPGSIAALDLEVKSMGFKPVVYGNIKGFLNLKPTIKEMMFWSKKQGISLAQVTAFTDGTKVQIEQALVANGLGAGITQRGLTGFACSKYEDGVEALSKKHDEVGEPISDFIVFPGGPAGVFVIAEHEKGQVPYLQYLKLGPGPRYVITRPYHLCHLEIPKTVMKVLKGEADYGFHNGPKPTVQVAAVAKRRIKEGEEIKRSLGSFSFRGEAVRIGDSPEAVPMPLLAEARIVRPVEEGHVVTFRDVELKPSLALSLWEETVAEVIGERLKLAEMAKGERGEKIKRFSWMHGLGFQQRLAGALGLL